MKKRIFVDLDMTLNSMSFDWCCHLGIQPEDVLYYGWIRDAYGPDAEAWWAQPGIYNIIKPLPGAVEFIATLAKVYEIVIITHTHKNQNPIEKEDWVEKYFLGIKDIIHAKDKYHHTKGSILIDDNPRHIYDHARLNGDKGILFNYQRRYGWAKPLTLLKNVYLAPSYEDVLEILQDDMSNLS